MNSLKLLLGMLHSTFVTQSENWKDHKIIRWSLKFVLLCACLFYASAIAGLLTKLPSGTSEYLLSNMFEPAHFLMLIVLSVYAMTGVFAGVMASKIQKTL